MSTSAKKIRLAGQQTFPENARKFLRVLHAHPEGYTLLYHRGEFYVWNQRNWVAVSADALQAQVSRFLQNSVYVDASGVNRNIAVNRDTLGNMMVAIRNETFIPEETETNTWLAESAKGGANPDPSNLIPLQNGILNAETRTLHPSTPRFFNTYSLAFEYNPKAGPPVVLEGFMESIFGGDQQRRELLQEIMGYLSTPRTSAQKMFALIGPARCGKGTIARLVEALVGKANYAATSLSGLGETHGLQNIATKPVVILGDAASTGRAPGRALENLLQIVGEDSVEVNPKNRQPYSAKLPCRFLMLANDLPELPDKSEALRSRTILLRFQKSFVGQENEELGGMLNGELAAIFNWTLDGLDRLRGRKWKFVQPELGKEDLDAVSLLVSPERAFARELLVFSSEVREDSSDLFAAWRNWCYENNVRVAGSKEALGKALKRIDPYVVKGKMPRVGGQQAQATIGVMLTPEARVKYVKSEAEFRLGTDPGGGWPRGL